MRLRRIVLSEMFERKTQLVTSFVAILLGVAVVVSIKNISFYSEKAVARELDALGTNILVLPKSASVQDYYSADMGGAEFPEEYVTRLTASDMQGLDNLSPKLSLPVELSGRRFTLTGILPKSEFRAKAAWRGAGVFSRPKGCGQVAEIPGLTVDAPRESLVRKRVIETLARDEVLVGADVASALGLGEDDHIELLGRPFRITSVLPQTGTVDDSRIFAHLHTVQELGGRGHVVNAIEIVGCCNEISGGLVDKINKLLPEARVVTISQIVDTQIRTNGLMSKLSAVFLAIIVIVGGASIANYMYSNVHERRREIGALMAMGAGSRTILRLFLLKAALMGLAGGAGGYVVGAAMAVVLGPRLAHISVPPMPGLIPWALGLSVVIAAAASYFPARRAAQLDPFTALQEI